MMASNGHHADGSLEGIHVLLVEDEEEARDLLKLLLTYSGAFVTAVPSARDALDLMAHIVPDVVVSDISMPGQDGCSLLQTIRALPASHGGAVPAVAVTALDDAQTGRVLASGFHACLRKPVDGRQLCGLIATLVPAL